MEKSKLYTRTGDDGTTSLVGGKRAKKNSVRLEAYGTVDEFNSVLGALGAAWREAFPDDFDTHNLLTAIQSELFNIGAYLATEYLTPVPCKGLAQADIDRVEEAIDTIDLQVPPLKSFVLPGGSMSASLAHIARAICRRAERRVLDLADQAPVAPEVLAYLNRVSDLLFVLARQANNRIGLPDVPWTAPAE